MQTTQTTSSLFQMSTLTLNTCALTPFTAHKIDEIIRKQVIPEKQKSRGDLIDSVSLSFLDTPYKANTLTGGLNIKEVLVANFEEVDCFTLIDYVEALSGATDLKTFLNNLVRTRYVGECVDYFSRKHFFSDWFATSPQNVNDVTSSVSPASISVKKNLNCKSGTKEYIPGLGITPRTINYIPTAAINKIVLGNLENGDFVGIYSPLEGLDVTHVGIVIKKGEDVWFRNASSLQENMKVVDSPFMEYIKSKPGILVLRGK